MPAPYPIATPYRVVFVCLGNICRSPMAEVVLRTMLVDAGRAEQVAVRSAGTGPWHVGDGADPGSVRALHRRGYDGSSHRARQFGPADFAGQDLVVGLDRANVRSLRAMAANETQAAKVALLRDFDPATAPSDRGRRDVPDPYDGPDADFEQALDLIEAACHGLLAALPVGAR